MNPVFARFYADYRRLLIGIAAFSIVTIVLAICSNRLNARIEGVHTELAASEAKASEAFLVFAREWRRKELVTTARARIDDLYDNTLRMTSQRFPNVDLGLKAIATKFSMAPNSLAYGRSLLQREELEQLTVTLNVKGNYRDVRHFIAELENAQDDEGRDLFLSIEQVNLADTSDIGSEIRLSVGVATYFHEPAEVETKSKRTSRPRGRG